MQRPNDIHALDPHPFSWSSSKSASVRHSFLQSEYQSSGAIITSVSDHHPSTSPFAKEDSKHGCDTFAIPIKASDDGSEIKSATDISVTSMIDMGVAHQQHSELDIDDDYFLQTSSSSSSLTSNSLTPPSSESSSTILHHSKLAHNNSVLLSKRLPQSDTTTTTSSNKPATSSSSSAPSAIKYTNTTTPNANTKLDMVVPAAQQEAAAASVLKDVRASHARLRKSASSFRNGQTPVWALLAQRQGKLKPEAAAEMARARMAAATAAAVMRESETFEEEKEISQSLPQKSRSFSHPPLQTLNEVDELEPHQDFTNEYISPTYRSLSDRVSYNRNLRRPPHRLTRPASPSPKVTGSSSLPPGNGQAHKLQTTSQTSHPT